MPTFFVHRYDVVRVKVAVEAADHAGAMLAADEYLANHHPVPLRFATNNENLAIQTAPLPMWLQVDEPGQEVTGYLIDEPGDAEYERSASYHANHIRFVDPQIDHADFCKADWRYTVDNCDTVLGYAEWVSAQREQAAESSES